MSTSKTELEDLENRRTEPRTSVRLPLICKIDNRDYPGESIDVSFSGMRLRLPVAVTPEQRMHISAAPAAGLSGRPNLLCRTSWVRPLGDAGFEIGTSYADSEENLATSWVQSAIQILGLRERINRRYRRYTTRVEAELQDAHGRPLSWAICVNLSNGGALIHPEKPIPADSLVHIKLKTPEGDVILQSRVVERKSPEKGHKDLQRLRFLPRARGQQALLTSLLRSLQEEPEVETGLAPGIAPLAAPATLDPASGWPASPAVLATPPPARPRVKVPSSLLEESKETPAIPKPAWLTGEKLQNRSPSVWGARMMPLQSVRPRTAGPVSSDAYVEPVSPDPEAPFQS